MRKITAPILTIMTLRGYTGESVKARADAWAAAGETDLADEIFKRRSNVVKKINALELGVFAMQTNDKKKMVSPDELQALRKDSIVAVDAVIEKMYCQLKEDGSERRWRSGACEILPLNPNLRDLAY